MLRTDFQSLDDSCHSDIAIVGAGISGLYCAWRLLDADPDVTVTVLERLDRTGGRLDSDIVEIAPGEKVREEEGGMRFNYDMSELMTLNAALGLCDQIVSFPMGTPDMPNRFSIRGTTFTLQDAADSDQMIWSDLYDLKPEETGLSPTDLVTAAYRTVLMANNRPYRQGITPDDWTDFRENCTWRGIAMNEWQMWGLLRDMGYSEECIQMLTETIGFAGPLKSLANAGDAFQILADFPKDPHYYTFQMGFSTLPNAIAQRLENDYPGRVRIVLSTNVDSISGAEGNFDLTLTQAILPVNARPVMAGATKKHLNARQLVLAAASKGCQDLYYRSPALNSAPDAERLWDALYASLGMKLMKINLYFTKPWWHNEMTGRPAVKFGPNFSNLPVNAVYPFYALPEEGSEPQTGLPDIRDAAAALTIYCDFDNTNFWHGLQNVGPKFDADLQRKQNAKVPQVMYPASVAVVQEAQKQLALLFGTNCVPDPVLTSYRLWDGNEDFEFAYHQWRMNTRDSEVRAFLANPVKGLYVCNEAFSDMQGWVNGSLRSCNLALEKLGMALFGSPIAPLTNKPCPEPETKAAPKARPLGLWGG
ncbi:flavin monoamine oxidase family protein [Tropicibacter oceani]|uniref:Tryptophan 2-monooxygenase n=1 Tax=Tropicibacter oceani TaxID=3058420 RepID=A0ABY8QE78_9RHOB|nr:FAD-dependent oxidoreductase [Tropicibacter oceani]WGW02914.1 FAD-dependent oxidoreductase [Tropicibacter oceani]